VLPSARKKRFSAVQRHYGPDLLRRNYAAHQVPHAHQVVGRAGRREGVDLGVIVIISLAITLGFWALGFFKKLRD
jgi:hypothetical protein